MTFRIFVLVWAGVAALSSQNGRPVVDGVLGAAEWSGARHELLSAGGDLYFMVNSNQLSIALKSASAGLASICVGDQNTVTIFHASAALGSARYDFTGGQWRQQTKFDFALRDSPRSRPTAADQAAHFDKAGWLANASAAGNVAREYRVRLRPEFKYLAVAYLPDSPETPSFWPPTATDDCTATRTVQGWLPSAPRFNVATWHKIVRTR